MIELPFNIYALAHPTTPAEYIALLDETLAELDYLNEQLDKSIQAMENNANKK